MQIAIVGKNLDLTPSLRAHVERKVGKLARFFEEPPTAQVTLAVERDRHIVEITLAIGGWLLRGEEACEDMYASVDRVVEKLERQIHKYKTRLIRKPRQQGAAAAAEAEEPPPDDPAPDLEVVRVKRFALKPMTVGEALLQMTLLGHDFFVFRDADAGGALGVVYRRRDGRFGLIEPEA